MPKVPKASSQYLSNKKITEGRMKLIFCLQINVKCFLKLILSLILYITYIFNSFFTFDNNLHTVQAADGR